jgi:ribosomal protein L16/L10AE
MERLLFKMRQTYCLNHNKNRLIHGEGQRNHKGVKVLPIKPIPIIKEVKEEAEVAEAALNNNRAALALNVAKKVT